MLILYSYFIFYKVRATTDRRRTAASPSSSAPISDVRQEIIFRLESYRAQKGLKNDTMTSDSKVEKDVLIEILTDLGQVGSALKVCLNRLSGLTVSEVATWIQERKDRDGVFSGLSHFSPVETDNIPGQSYAEDSEISRSSSVRTHDKMYERESASSKTNNSKASSTQGKGQGSIAGGGSVTSSARGSVKGGSGKSNKSIDKLKLVQNSTALKIADSRADTRRLKNEKATNDVFTDDTDTDADRRRRNVLSPVPEMSQSSSGYSSSPALSDSEEEDLGGGKYPRDEDDSESDSGDDMRLGGLPQGMGPHGVNTIYEDDDEYSSEGSPETPPPTAFTPGHLNFYPPNAVTKSEKELAKIEEEDELYSDTNDDNDDEDEDNNDEDDDDDGRMFLSNTHKTQGLIPDWRDWTDALSAGSRDRNWLMKSLLLISELCRSNFRAQKKSAHFLPPELLLSLLQSGKLSDQNRLVICLFSCL